MAPDIDSVTLILKDGRVWDAVKPYLDKFLLVQVKTIQIFRTFFTLSHNDTPIQTPVSL